MSQTSTSSSQGVIEILAKANCRKSSFRVSRSPLNGSLAPAGKACSGSDLLAMATTKMLSLRIAPRTVSQIFSSQTRTLMRPAVNTSQLKEGRRTGALAMKVGMIPLWDAWGERHATTVLHLDSCQVVQVKTEDTEGYTSMQLGVGEAKTSRVKTTAMGHFNKADVIPKRKLMEFRVTPDSLLPVGTTIQAMHFIPGQLVDICGISKGKGFQGVMKRWNFKGGRASHGNSLSHRVPGSTGGRQDPGRTFKGKKMPGNMGNERITTQNLKILKIDPIRDLIYVKGSVPGNAGTFIRVTDAVKGPRHPTLAPHPTYLVAKDDPEYPQYSLVAPVSENDSGKLKEPEDAY